MVHKDIYLKKINEESLSLADLITDIDASIPIVLYNMPELKEDNLQDLYRSPAKETCLISLSPQSLIDNECISVAAGEGRQPKSILNDTFCKELSFLHLLPTGKYGYQVQREKTVLTEDFHVILCKFSSDTDYNFLLGTFYKIKIRWNK